MVRGNRSYFGRIAAILLVSGGNVFAAVAREENYLNYLPRERVAVPFVRLETAPNWQIDQLVEAIPDKSPFAPRRVLYAVISYPGGGIRNYGQGYDDVGEGEPRMYESEFSDLLTEKGTDRLEQLAGLDAIDSYSKELHVNWFERLLPSIASPTVKYNGYSYVDLPSEQRIVLKFFFEAPFNKFALRSRRQRWEPEKTLFSVSTDPRVIGLLSGSGEKVAELSPEDSIRYLIALNINSDARLELLKKYWFTQNNKSLRKLVDRAKSKCIDESEKFFSSSFDRGIAAETNAALADYFQREKEFLSPDFFPAAQILLLAHEDPAFHREIEKFYFEGRHFHFLWALSLLPAEILNPLSYRSRFNPSRVLQDGDPNPLFVNGSDGGTKAQKAAVFGSVEIYQNARDGDDAAAIDLLTLALRAENIPVAEYILSHEVNFSGLAQDQIDGVVRAAAPALREEAITLLLRYKPDLNLSQPLVGELLNVMAKAGNGDGLRLLTSLKQASLGSIKSIIATLGQDPQCLESLRVLIEARARLTDDAREWMAQALYFASEYRNKAAQKLLLEAGADPDYHSVAKGNNFTVAYEKEIDEILRTSWNQTFVDLFAQHKAGPKDVGLFTAREITEAFGDSPDIVLRMIEARDEIKGRNHDVRLDFVRRIAHQGSKYLEAFTALFSTHDSPAYFFKMVAYDALENNDFDMLDDAIAQMGSLNPDDYESKNDLLHRAARQNNVRAILDFIAKGAGVNEPDQSAHSPLYYAVNANARKAAQVLLDNGAELRSMGDREPEIRVEEVEGGAVKAKLDEWIRSGFVSAKR